MWLVPSQHTMQNGSHMDKIWTNCLYKTHVGLIYAFSTTVGPTWDFYILVLLNTIVSSQNYCMGPIRAQYKNFTQKELISTHMRQLYNISVYTTDEMFTFIWILWDSKGAMAYFSVQKSKMGIYVLKINIFVSYGLVHILPT